MNHRLENPKRVTELNPAATLLRIGLKDGDAFCDIGAGTGIFTFPAAERTKGDVCAVEISDEMLAILRDKKQARGAENVVIRSGVGEVPSASCRIALLCTVLHELPDAQEMIGELKRILAGGGIVAVIEFHKRQTAMGPPLERRLSPVQVEELFARQGFCKADYFELGENFYTIIFSI